MDDEHLEKACYWNEDEEKIARIAPGLGATNDFVVGKKAKDAKSFTCEGCGTTVYLKRKRKYCTDCQVESYYKHRTLHKKKKKKGSMNSFSNLLKYLPKKEPQIDFILPVTEKIVKEKEVELPKAVVYEKKVPQELTGTKTITTTNTYQAAFYLSRGAYLSKVRVNPLNQRQTDKKGFKSQWVMTISGVSQLAIDEIMNGKAVMKIEEIAAYRRRLKENIKHLLRKKPQFAEDAEYLIKKNKK